MWLLELRQHQMTLKVTLVVQHLSNCCNLTTLHVIIYHTFRYELEAHGL